MTKAHTQSDRLQLVKFCLVGAAGYAVNTSAFALSVTLGGQELMAATWAFMAAVAVNFWCNRRWTFAATDDPPGRQAARFFVVSVASFLFGAAVLELLVEFARLPALPAQAASIVAATPLNFLGNKTWSFADPEPPGDAVAAAGDTAGRSAWLVLPTYNEAENLEPFVRQVLPRLAAAAPEHHVLIVDDSSPDGTGEIADRLAAELEPVHVLHRAEKDGLGRAYAAGFERALREGAGLVLQMDADFSHDPDSVPSLIAAARQSDLVIGSRYVPGGGVADWGLGRRLLSRGGSWYARTVLGVQVRDLTGGFKCFRRELLERLDLSRLETAGFGFQIELTYRAIQSGARVGEVPIHFRDRRHGVSKMSSGIVFEALLQVLTLRLRRPRRASTVARPARAAA
jgi:dolichol-phosphate mannosyltransferase